MAITSFKRLYNSPSTAGREFSLANRTANRTFDIPFLATTDVRMDEDDLIKDPYIPGLGTTFDQNPLCRLSRVNATRNPDNNLLWIVTLSYSSDMPKPEEIEDDNPLNAPVKRSSGWHEIQIPMRRDVNGNLVRLTNGMIVDPPIMVRRSVRVYRFVKNYPTWNIATEDNYHDHLNSTTWMGKAAETVYCQISSEENWRKGYNYFTVSFEFHYNKLGWQPLFYNYSTQQRELVTNNLIPILNDKFLPVTEPWPIDSDGRKIASADILTTLPALTEVDGYETADFNDLGLPLGA